MKFNYFSQGTRVRYTGRSGKALKNGEIGTVVCHDEYTNIAVRWDKENESRHTCSELTDLYHGWWVLPQNIEIIKEEDLEAT